jgi:hypothetical protein
MSPSSFHTSSGASHRLSGEQEKGPDQSVSYVEWLDQSLTYDVGYGVVFSNRLAEPQRED